MTQGPKTGGSFSAEEGKVVHKTESDAHFIKTGGYSTSHNLAHSIDSPRLIKSTDRMLPKPLQGHQVK